MRKPQQAAQTPKSVTFYLLVGTVAVFVLQQIIHVFFPTGRSSGMSPFFFRDWLALSGTHFKELKVWTLLSYSFLHSLQNIWHIVGNMAGLFFIGHILEPQLGRKPFLVLYLGGALAGGLFFLALNFNSNALVIGASAAVFALLTCFCLRHPEQPITLLLFFVLPVTIKPKYLLKIAIALSIFFLLFYELGNLGTSIAHSAHLGGILFGFLFHRYAYLLENSGSKTSKISGIELPKWFTRSKNKSYKLNYTVNRTSSNKTTQTVDRILDKINEKGFEALTEKEKEILHNARENLS
jgi:membrane associated rhomboid family serine protease